MFGIGNLLGGVAGVPKEQRTQLHFRDDGTFQFRRLEIEETFLVEKKDDVITRGWKHFYRNQFPFPGYKNIKADQVTLSFDRDIILDPFGIVEKEKEAPDKSKKILGDVAGDAREITGVKAWLGNIGEARRLKMLANRAKKSNYNKLIMFLGSALMIELLIIGFEVLTGQVD